MSPKLVVCGIVLGVDGRMLLTQRLPPRSYPFSWECPGGKVEGGETHFAALKRELYEELGIVAEQFRGPHVHAWMDLDYAVFFYHVTKWSGQPKTREGQGLGWFDETEWKAALGLSPALEAAAQDIMTYLESVPGYGVHIRVEGV